MVDILQENQKLNYLIMKRKTFNSQFNSNWKLLMQTIYTNNHNYCTINLLRSSLEVGFLQDGQVNPPVDLLLNHLNQQASQQM